MDHCRTCGSPIVWVETRNKKGMPLDPLVLTVITDQGETVKGRVSHFVTCPQREAWRRGKR